MLSYFTYSSPFKSNFKTAKASYHTRKGVILQLKKEGITALGEAAPLPGFSTKTLDELINQIQEHKSKITDFFENRFTVDDVNGFLDRSDFYPSLQFAIFSLSSLFLAQKSKTSLQEFLFKNDKNVVNVNAVVDLKKRNALPQVRQYVAQGFKTVKIKTGPYWDETFTQLQKIRDEYEDLNIRLDANRSWRLDEAIEYLEEAEETGVEYCEEPFAKITEKKLQSLKNSTAVPVALDETMRHWPEVKNIAAMADAFILKPTAIGSFTTIKDICDFANKNNKKIIFTTVLGTAAERLVTASLAAGFGSPHMAHGLNTGKFLSKDIWDDSTLIANGNYKLPDIKQLQQLMQSDLQNISIKSI